MPPCQHAEIAVAVGLKFSESIATLLNISLYFLQNVKSSKSSTRLPDPLPFASTGDLFSRLKATAWSGGKEKVRCAYDLSNVLLVLFST